jgi:hypothetical protein
VMHEGPFRSSSARRPAPELASPSPRELQALGHTVRLVPRPM